MQSIFTYFHYSKRFLPCLEIKHKGPISGCCMDITLGNYHWSWSVKQCFTFASLRMGFVPYLTTQLSSDCSIHLHKKVSLVLPLPQHFLFRHSLHIWRLHSFLASLLLMFFELRMKKSVFISHPWKCFRPCWMKIWATRSSERCPSPQQGFGARWSLRSSPSQTILWFCNESMIFLT